jgi:hypothetical protein
VLEPGNFATGAAEECVRSRLVQHFGQIARYLLNLPPEFDKLLTICEKVMVHLEIAGLIASNVYDVAAPQIIGFTPLFVPPHVVQEWKTKLLAAWDECAKPPEMDSGFIQQRRQTMVATFDKIAAMAQPQWDVEWQRMREHAAK